MQSPDSHTINIPIVETTFFSRTIFPRVARLLLLVKNYFTQLVVRATGRRNIFLQVELIKIDQNVSLSLKPFIIWRNAKDMLFNRSIFWTKTLTNSNIYIDVDLNKKKKDNIRLSFPRWIPRMKVSSFSFCLLLTPLVFKSLANDPIDILLILRALFFFSLNSLISRHWKASCQSLNRTPMQYHF